jgi:hypothetical protein
MSTTNYNNNIYNNYHKVIDKTKINSTMEAPSTTLLRRSGIQPLAKEELRIAILEACSEVMPEGHMLQVAEYLKNNGFKRDKNHMYLFDVILWREEKGHGPIHHSLYAITVRNEHKYEVTYIKIKSHGEYPEMQIEIKASQLHSYMTLLLCQHVFEKIHINRRWDEKFFFVYSYEEYRKHLSDDKNHYDNFVYYCCDKIARGYAFWKKPENYRNFDYQFLF